MEAYTYMGRQSKLPIPLLDVSLSFFEKEKKKKITKKLLVSQVALNSFTTFHSNIKALFPFQDHFVRVKRESAT